MSCVSCVSSIVFYGDRVCFVFVDVCVYIAPFIFLRVVTVAVMCVVSLCAAVCRFACLFSNCLIYVLCCVAVMCVCCFVCLCLFDYLS